MFLEKGKVFRKEGEKKRKKIGNRSAAEGNFCNSETVYFLLKLNNNFYSQRRTRLRNVPRKRRRDDTYF